MNELLAFLSQNNSLVSIILGVLFGIFASLLSSSLFNPLITALYRFLQKGRYSYQIFEDKYLQRMAERYSSTLAVQDIARSSPRVRLDSVFVTPNITNNEGITSKFSLDFLLNQSKKHFLILGAPGSGKSTLLRHIALDLCYLIDDRPSDRIIPFYISLREISTLNSNTLPNAILDSNSSSIIAPDSYQQYFLSKLDSGRCIILLDGLDEFDDTHSKFDIFTTINEWRNTYQNCYFIVTSRPSAIKSYQPLSNFEILHINNFNSSQISDFIKKWTSEVFSSDTDDLENALDLPRGRNRAIELEYIITQNQKLLDLARVPLLLTLICITHFFTNAIPTNRAYLYQNAVNLLMRNAADPKIIYDIQNIIEKIAFDYQLKRSTIFDRNSIKKLIVDAKSTFEITLSTDEICHNLFEKTGILVEKDQDVYAFAHITFQEYLAARYIINQNIEPADIKRYYNDSWWRDILLLTTEIKRDSTSLVKDILNYPDIERMDKLYLLAQILSTATKIDQETYSKLIYDIIREILNVDNDIQSRKNLLAIASNIPDISEKLIRG